MGQQAHEVRLMHPHLHAGQLTGASIFSRESSHILLLTKQGDPKISSDLNNLLDLRTFRKSDPLQI
jgi:hypothetical protein